MKAKLVLTVVICFLSISICQSQILKTLKGHDGDVLCIRFFPNSKLFATGGTDDNIIIWDYDNLTKVKNLESNLSNILSIAISADETKIFTSHDSPTFIDKNANNRTLALWDLNYSKETYPIDLNNKVNGVCTSSDGNKVYYAKHDYYYHRYSKSEYMKEKIIYCEFSFKDKNLKQYLVEEVENTYKLDYETKDEIKEGSNYMKVLNINDNLLAGCLKDGYIAIIDKDKKNVSQYLYSDKNKFTGDCFNVSRDSKLIAAANYGGENWIYLWDIQSGKSIRTFKGHKNDVMCVAFSPDNKFLASGDQDDIIILWDIKTGKKIKTLTGHKGDVNCISFSPDGKYIFSGGGDKNIIVWDALSLLPDLKIYATEYELSIGILKKLQDEKMEQIDLIQSNFSPKGEFETTDAYEQRLKEKNDKIAGVNEFYNAKFEEMKANKRQELDVLKERKQSEIEVAIQNSRRDTIVKISNVSRYNADKQTYAITIKGMTKNVFMPIDKAPKFKENWKKAKVKCKMELFDDLKNYKYFDFVIIDPVTNEEIIFKDINEK